jgi:hypothetical protein
MSKKLALVASLLAPFIVHSLLIFLDRKYFQTDSGTYDWISILASSTIGLLFLFKEYRAKIFWIGLFYFPGMVLFLFWYTFLFVGVVFKASL